MARERVSQVARVQGVAILARREVDQLVKVVESTQTRRYVRVEGSVELQKLPAKPWPEKARRSVVAKLDVRTIGRVRS